MTIMTYLSNRIKAAFEEHPCRFFTEQDIHSELALIATEYLRSKGNLQAKTLDGYIVNCIHHEYPTPFRCQMERTEFRAVSEQEFEREKRRNPKFRARRGYFDLVIFNPEYISSNNLRVISAKDYRHFLPGLAERKWSALDIAVEVVYFPTFDNKPHYGKMDRRFKSTIQDYKKLVELMKITTPTPFCKEAAMMFFSNTRYKDELNKKFRTFPFNANVELFRYISQCM